MDINLLEFESLVTISLVTYNSEKVIIQCMESIPQNAPILIYDNHSTDNTINRLSQFSTHIMQNITLSRKNRGFGAAHNDNALLVQTKYMLVLNPDCFISSSSLSQLIKTAEDNPGAAIVGPCYKKQELSSCPKKVDFISGACMLLRMTVFNEIGFFDKNIFLYFEDNELSLRAKKYGYELLIAPNALVRHLGRSSCPPNRKTFFIRAFYYGRAETYMRTKAHKSELKKRKTIVKLQSHYLKRAVKKLSEKHYPYFKEYFYKFLGVTSCHFKM